MYAITVEIDDCGPIKYPKNAQNQDRITDITLSCEN
jgi:hypothetical protein